MGTELDVRTIILEAIDMLDRRARSTDNAEEAVKYYNAMEKLYAEYNHAIEIDNQAYFDAQKDLKEGTRIEEEMRKNLEAREVEVQKNRIEVVKIILRVIEILAAVIGLPCLVLFQLRCQQLGALPPKFMDTIVTKAINFLAL